MQARRADRHARRHRSIARSGLVALAEGSRGGVRRYASHLPLATFWPRLRRSMHLLAMPSALHAPSGRAFGAPCTFWQRLRRSLYAQ